MSIHPSDAPDAPAPPSSPDDLTAVVERHAEAVYRVALSLVHDPSLADDVVQDTMITAWRKSPVPTGQEIPRNWLLKVARNKAISMLRARKDDLRSHDTLPEADAGPETSRMVEGRAKLDDVMAALGQLDEEARVLIVMREVDGLSYEEIADALGLPLPTVKTRLFRARRALKEAVKEWR